ncbi:hypothetical protein [Haloarchaeobius iranensis]|uniref:Uncharacterized protein n=1 Tax=Haloarchaeobius iranensis TaxID=996166 RepID=A0A1G9TYH9_9EURY|nr:hypothetical protein [Haloarchaeobius iranensis]SDM52726.1 hypothetical protein SAMN05192554_103202 [Haloarchaeobius iranensis]
MSERVADAIVRRELLLSLVYVAVAGSVSTIGWSPRGLAIGTVVAAVSFLLVAASDRSEAGKWALVGIGTLAIVALAVSTVTNSVPVGAIAPSMLGMAVGFGLNRVLFGVLSPVPEPRRRREAAD